MEELFKENYVEPPKEKLFLGPELLENVNELEDINVYNQVLDEHEVRVLRESLFQFFRQIDHEDLGMISHEECLEVTYSIIFIGIQTNGT
jgi:hypothetical protein